MTIKWTPPTQEELDRRKPKPTAKPTKKGK